MRLRICCVLCCLALALSKQGSIPALAQVAAKNKITGIAIADGNAVQAEFQVGPGGKVRLEFKFEQGSHKIIEGNIVANTRTRQVTAEARNQPNRHHCPTRRSSSKGPDLI